LRRRNAVGDGGRHRWTSCGGGSQSTTGVTANASRFDGPGLVDTALSREFRRGRKQACWRVADDCDDHRTTAASAYPRCGGPACTVTVCGRLVG